MIKKDQLINSLVEQNMPDLEQLELDTSQVLDDQQIEKVIDKIDSQKKDKQ